MFAGSTCTFRMIESGMKVPHRTESGSGGLLDNESARFGQGCRQDFYELFGRLLQFCKHVPKNCVAIYEVDDAYGMPGRIFGCPADVVL